MMYLYNIVSKINKTINRYYDNHNNNNNNNMPRES